ncbi:MAG: hypothetical protein ACR2PR_08975 [Pseudohongiellaceae bacterium]
MAAKKRTRSALPEHLTRCHRNSGHLTSARYAHAHFGLCKRCYNDGIDTGTIPADDTPPRPRRATRQAPPAPNPYLRASRGW